MALHLSLHQAGQRAIALQIAQRPVIQQGLPHSFFANLHLAAQVTNLQQGFFLVVSRYRVEAQRPPIGEGLLVVYIPCRGDGQLIVVYGLHLNLEGNGHHSRV